MIKTATILTKSLNIAKIEVTELTVRDSFIGLLFRKLLGKKDTEIVRSRATRIVIAAIWSEKWSEEDIQEIDTYFRQFVPPSCEVLIESSLASFNSV